ncbi:protein hook [Diplogelasinospora grovesii]|uniref:Protein hook n=1 Tax=Diplogelasinospora grovesii TaxID=303347 RepID=A0AAN6NG73_9PEZI|nr:protein hook [Diplogelasinospora grovesii]
MTQFTPAAQAALLKWVNTFDTKRRVETVEDLRDGLILGQILEQILGAAEFHSSSLIQSPSSWTEKKQNLETVYRGLARFLRHDNPFLAPSPSEFRAMAENPDENGICEFLSAFLTAACLGSLSRTYVPKIMTLDKASQGEIARILEYKNYQKKEREAHGKDEAYEEEDVDLDVQAFRDPDLMEEELEQLKDKCDMLKKQNADLQSRLDKLLMTHEVVLNDLRASQNEVASQRRVRGGTDAGTAIRDLRNEIREKMAEIDRLEDLVEKETLRSNRLEKENEALRTKADRVKDLEDKVTVLEHETKEQQKQIKGLENYKKKAQDLTAIQQRNRVLEEQIIQLELDMKDYDDMKTLSKKLQTEIEEKRKALASNELEILDMINSKNAMQDSLEELKRVNEWLESKRQLDEGTIRELEEKMQLGGGPQLGSESPGASTSKFNLEQELETTADPATAALRLELSRLKAENNVLRNNMTVASENERLRSELDSVNQKMELYRVRCSEATEKQAVAQDQINAIANNMTRETDSAFINMRKDLIEATTELEKHRKKVQQLEAEAADRERELLAARTDLTAIGEESNSALAVLKSADDLISSSLKIELDATRRQLNLKILEVEQMKEQLMDALVSKDKIRKQLDEVVAGGTGQLTPAPSVTPASDTPTKPRRDDAEKSEKLKAALRLKMEQLEKAEQDKYDLQRRLKAAENGSAFAAQKGLTREKAASEQVIKNLQRENAMITTAWYDLTSRLQSNHVVLQRRHDAPRSWLNKQRQMVNGGFSPTGPPDRFVLANRWLRFSSTATPRR